MSENSQSLKIYPNKDHELVDLNCNYECMSTRINNQQGSIFTNSKKRFTQIGNDLNQLEDKFSNFEKTLKELTSKPDSPNQFENKHNSLKRGQVQKIERKGKENTKYRIEKIGKMTKKGEQVKIDNKIYTCRKFPASYFQNINTLRKTESKIKLRKNKRQEKEERKQKSPKQQKTLEQKSKMQFEGRRRKQSNLTTRKIVRSKMPLTKLRPQTTRLNYNRIKNNSPVPCPDQIFCDLGVFDDSHQFSPKKTIENQNTNHSSKEKFLNRQIFRNHKPQTAIIKKRSYFTIKSNRNYEDNNIRIQNKNNQIQAQDSGTDCLQQPIISLKQDLAGNLLWDTEQKIERNRQQQFCKKESLQEQILIERKKIQMRKQIQMGLIDQNENGELIMRLTDRQTLQNSLNYNLRFQIDQNILKKQSEKEKNQNIGEGLQNQNEIAYKENVNYVDQNEKISIEASLEIKAPQVENIKQESMKTLNKKEGIIDPDNSSCFTVKNNRGIHQEQVVLRNRQIFEGKQKVTQQDSKIKKKSEELTKYKKQSDQDNSEIQLGHQKAEFPEFFQNAQKLQFQNIDSLMQSQHQANSQKNQGQMNCSSIENSLNFQFNGVNSQPNINGHVLCSYHPVQLQNKMIQSGKIETNKPNSHLTLVENEKYCYDETQNSTQYEFLTNTLGQSAKTPQSLCDDLLQLELKHQEYRQEIRDQNQSHHGQTSPSILSYNSNQIQFGKEEDQIINEARGYEGGLMALFNFEKKGTKVSDRDSKNQSESLFAILGPKARNNGDNLKEAEQQELELEKQKKRSSIQQSLYKFKQSKIEVFIADNQIPVVKVFSVDHDSTCNHTNQKRETLMKQSDFFVDLSSCPKIVHPDNSPKIADQICSFNQLDSQQMFMHPSFQENPQMLIPQTGSQTHLFAQDNYQKIEKVDPILEYQQTKQIENETPDMLESEVNQCDFMPIKNCLKGENKGYAFEPNFTIAEKSQEQSEQQISETRRQPQININKTDKEIQCNQLDQSSWLQKKEEKQLINSGGRQKNLWFSHAFDYSYFSSRHNQECICDCTQKKFTNKKQLNPKVSDNHVLKQPISEQKEKNQKKCQDLTHHLKSVQEQFNRIGKQAEILKYVQPTSIEAISVPFLLSQTITSSVSSTAQSCLLILQQTAKKTNTCSYFSRLQNKDQKQRLWLCKNGFKCYQSQMFEKLGSMKEQQILRLLNRLNENFFNEKDSITGMLRMITGCPLLVLTQKSLGKLRKINKHPNLYSFAVSSDLKVHRIHGYQESQQKKKQNKDSLKIEELVSKKINLITAQDILLSYPLVFLTCISPEYYIRHLNLQPTSCDDSCFILEINAKTNSKKIHCILSISQNLGSLDSVLIYQQISSAKYKQLGKGVPDFLSARLLSGTYLFIFSVSPFKNSILTIASSSQLSILKAKWAQDLTSFIDCGGHSFMKCSEQIQ